MKKSTGQEDIFKNKIIFTSLYNLILGKKIQPTTQNVNSQFFVGKYCQRNLDINI